MAARIHIDDLEPEQRAELGIRKPREAQFSKDECRSWALKCLAVLASLSRAERDRVLRQALKVNKV